MDSKAPMNTISFVIPVYNEAENIRELYCRINAALPSLNAPHEMIFVDDGSKDGTYEVLDGIRANDSHIKLVKFAKNRGQAYAFLAGFELAEGEVIITMDGDLQNDPADIPVLFRKISEGFDFVNGWRYDREDGLFRSLVSKFENWVVAGKTGVRLRDYGCSFTAARREIIEGLMARGSQARFIKPLLVRLAGSICEVKVLHHPRKNGVSKYGILGIMSSGLDFLFRFDPGQIKNAECRVIREEGAD